VAAGKTEAVVSIAQVGTGETKVYVSATEAGKQESDRLEVTVAAEAKTAKVAASDVVAVNNAGSADTFTVKAAVGTIVKVYDLETAGKVLGTATVAAGKTEAVVSIAQVGTAETKVYVSATETGKLESDRLEVTLAAEGKTDKVATGNITVANNVGKADTITVPAAVGAVVKVYDAATAGKLLGSAAVATGKTEGIVSISQLGVDATKVYVSVTETGKQESEREEVAVAAEAVTIAPAESAITIVNNAGKADTITVTDVVAGDIVKIFRTGTTTVIGSAIIAAGKLEATISIAQLGVDASSVDVTITSKDKRESTKTTKSYDAEA
ncbi:hypothetical protein SAMN04487969_14325, partial [Paenibacillus algorifonticola]